LSQSPKNFNFGSGLRPTVYSDLKSLSIPGVLWIIKIFLITIWSPFLYAVEPSAIEKQFDYVYVGLAAGKF
jgi:hypothetical protein